MLLSLLLTFYNQDGKNQFKTKIIFFVWRVLYVT